MRETCLHCALTDILDKWIRLNRRADNEAIVEMVGQFAAEVLARHGNKPVTIVVLEKTFDSKASKLH